MSQDTEISKTQDVEAFRKHLNEINAQARMGDQELPESDIERMVKMHKEEGLTVEQCIERLLDED